MPKVVRTSGASTSARAEPYSKKSPKSKSGEDKENVKPTSKSLKVAKSTAQFDGDWRDIVLQEKKGEVPCYDKASVVRTKLNKLIQEKKNIPGSKKNPGSKKKWSQASIIEELKGLEARSHPVADETGHGADLNTRQMGKFLKQSGGMGGGDSPVYYWGNVLLEKLRIASGEKKTKSRKEAEEK
ncbi:MAG: hypothetical protein Q9167_002946 [Letrouitia subvulpina]